MESSSPSAAALAVDREGNALGGLFQNIITDLRSGANNWDDLLLKANKFHAQLKSTISCSTAFLDSFQKIADMATTTRGGTKEIGSALTRLCLRNRSVEAKLKSMTSSMLDSFILPLQDRVDEWKKMIVQMDKEHNKEIKRLKQFRKKHYHSVGHLENNGNNGNNNGTTNNGAGGGSGNNTNTFRIKRRGDARTKSSKSSNSGTDFPRTGSIYDIDNLLIFDSMENGTGTGGGSTGNSTDPHHHHKEKYFMLEEVERNYVRRALLEERGHYCYFFKCLRPFIEEEISMLQEIIHLEEIVATLATLTNDPGALPASSETFLTSLQFQQQVSSSQDHHHHQHLQQHRYLMAVYGSEYGAATPTPSTATGSCLSRSRKSSISSMDSFNTLSTDSISIRNCKSLSQPNITPGFRPKSIASQDSGFLSHYQEYNVPNIGKVVIVNKNNKNPPPPPPPPPHHQEKSGYFKATTTTAVATEITTATDTIKRINCHQSSSSSVEYAATDQLFTIGATNGTGGQQPIYVNVYSTAASSNNNKSYTYISDGSKTPTNGQENNTGTEVLIKTGNKPKPPPPKPPIRHSSILSSKDLPPPPPPPPESKRSTLIYVPNGNTNNENSGDIGFPAPPPEAFIHPEPPSTNTICCRYSVPNTTHLVFCENQDCLKNLDNSNTTVLPLTLSSPTSNHHHNYGGNPYAVFETNIDHHSPMCNGHHQQYGTTTQDPYDRRRFHSTVNLSDH